MLSDSSSGSDFDVDDFSEDEVDGDEADGKDEAKVDVVIQNYTKSIVYCGVDSSRDAVFAIIARDLPQDVKTNYNYEPAMTGLLKVMVLHFTI